MVLSIILYKEEIIRSICFEKMIVNNTFLYNVVNKDEELFMEIKSGSMKRSLTEYKKLKS